VTLSEVAEFARANEFYDRRQRYAIDRLLERFEADPDFALRQRIEALAACYERIVATGELSITTEAALQEVARRLREALEPKP
jgi:hypothetical protein